MHRIYLEYAQNMHRRGQLLWFAIFRLSWAVWALHPPKWEDARKRKQKLRRSKALAQFDTFLHTSAHCAIPVFWCLSIPSAAGWCATSHVYRRLLLLMPGAEQGRKVSWESAVTTAQAAVPSKRLDARVLLPSQLYHVSSLFHIYIAYMSQHVPITAI